LPKFPAARFNTFSIVLSILSSDFEGVKIVIAVQLDKTKHIAFNHSGAELNNPTILSILFLLLLWERNFCNDTRQE
jgi:hypothetical protein